MMRGILLARDLLFPPLTPSLLFDSLWQMQAWWRGVMVRHELGPYNKKKKKKKGKGSGKKKGKGKGKKKR